VWLKVRRPGWGRSSIKFAKRHKVRVDLLKINKKKLDYLKNLSTLVFTGFSRSASEIEKSKLENFKINQNLCKNNDSARPAHPWF
jgi:galactokinase/mevalonate kinase-like predicted kinase